MIPLGIFIHLLEDVEEDGKLLVGPTLPEQGINELFWCHSGPLFSSKASATCPFKLRTNSMQ